jgi:cytidylate kinase
MSSTMNQRYFDTMGKLMSDLAARGNVMLVGRGGNRFLRDCPAAFHVRLVASRSARVRHFMEYHWVREAVAQTQLSESDAQRQRYFAAYFGADWADPLEYHLTVNAGRQTSAVDLIVRAATRFWNRASVPREGVTDG